MGFYQICASTSRQKSKAFKNAWAAHKNIFSGTMLLIFWILNPRIKSNVSFSLFAEDGKWVFTPMPKFASQKASHHVYELWMHAKHSGYGSTLVVYALLGLSHVLRMNHTEAHNLQFGAFYSKGLYFLLLFCVLLYWWLTYSTTTPTMTLSWAAKKVCTWALKRKAARPCHQNRQKKWAFQKRRRRRRVSTREEDCTVSCN